MGSPKGPSGSKRFWRTPAERRDPEAAQAGPRDEFPPDALTPIRVPDEADQPGRRRFLGVLGASAALASGVACSRGAGDTIVPYTKKPVEVVPGVADYYASTYQEGTVPFGVLVKAREGRPIHIDGNDEHPLFKGKTSHRAMAQIIDLYSPDRLRAPMVDGRGAGWADAQERVVAGLERAAASGKEVLLLSGAVQSPTQKAVLAELKKALPALVHVQWEPALSGSEREGVAAAFGEALVPRLQFEKATVIVSLCADFLGADGRAVPAIAGFASRRKLQSPDEPMNRVYVFEGSMTLTGANADERAPMKPSASAAVAFALARRLHERHAVALPPGVSPAALAAFDLEPVAKRAGLDAALLARVAADLARAGRTSLVVAGEAAPPEAHVACALLNVMLGAEGETVDASRAPDPSPVSSYAEMASLVAAMAAGRFGAAVAWGVNPSYAWPDAAGWRAAFQKVPLRVRLGLMEDETAKDCQVVLPVHHWLESWGDYEAGTDLLSLQQPLVGALYDTRQAEEVLLQWAGALGGSTAPGYYDYLKSRWRREVYPTGSPAPFEAFFDACLHDGVLRREAGPRPPRALKGEAVASAAEGAAVQPPAGFELVLAPGFGLYDGRNADNGWLQELPDPVTKQTWGNAAILSAEDARRLGLEEGDHVAVQAGARSATLPALIQPGQAVGVVGLALGYGRETGSVGAGVGTNVFPLVGTDRVPFLRAGAQVGKAAGSSRLVRTQDHFRLHGRDIVRQWTLSEYGEHARHPEAEEEMPSLYEKERFPVHKWGMAIDLSACVGCSGCMVACQSENNIPVVGPDRVYEGRVMHWIRVDRYYEGAEENPRVAHEPMLCQQCDNAPCENVCPVAATTHSDEGLNQMAYNRCVGTRYCANNCPYKVRRFNFFDYTSTIRDPVDLAFNPEVTVRPRGVMEKCTFCVQRIQNAKQVAGEEGRPLRDGDIKPACAMACPAEAIVFGDLNDKESRVSKLSGSDRGFKVLSELGVRPAITYLADLRNPPGEGSGHEL